LSPPRQLELFGPLWAVVAHASEQKDWRTRATAARVRLKLDPQAGHVTANMAARGAIDAR
jgi:hypothetical protein